ncbi:MAG: cysteine synthase family protein [Thermoplasmatota archaeon]
MQNGGTFAGSILDTVGDTPLLKLDGVYAKLEATNPTGSIKDRLARYLVEQAEKRGELERGDLILEVTSGNTGISLAMIAAVKGYRFKAVMPRSMSPERRKMIRLFGGEVILTPAEEDMTGAVNRYEAYAAASDDVWLPRQFDNPDNIAAHRDGIGQEVADEVEDIDAVVVGVGTGGTLLGIAQALLDDVHIVAVEPAESPVLSGGPADHHDIQGIGEGFVPSLVEDNRELIDDIVTIQSADALDMQRLLAHRHGLLVGPSSGANMLAARQVAGRYENVVTVLPDRGERYINGSPD